MSPSVRAGTLSEILMDSLKRVQLVCRMFVRDYLIVCSCLEMSWGWIPRGPLNVEGPYLGRADPGNKPMRDGEWHHMCHFLSTIHCFALR